MREGIRKNVFESAIRSGDVLGLDASPFGKGGLRGILSSWHSQTLQISPNPSLPKRGTSTFLAAFVKHQQTLITVNNHGKISHYTQYRLCLIVNMVNTCNTRIFSRRLDAGITHRVNAQY